MTRIDEHKFPICARCKKLMPMDSVWLECGKLCEYAQFCTERCQAKWQKWSDKNG